MINLRLPRTEAFARLEALSRERILILDGAMGTQIQSLGLSEEDYTGCGGGCACHIHSDKPQKGNNDLLILTRPEAIEEIHYRYAKAGAFGGSRQGLYDATLGSNTARAAGELANTSRAQNYQQGLAAWQADANRMLSADSLTAQLAAQVGVANAQNILKALQGNQTADLDSQRMGISALQAAMQGQLGAGHEFLGERAAIEGGV